MTIFDSKKGLIQSVEKKLERDVKDDLARAEKIIRELEKEMFVEDLIKLVQKTCSLTNDEVYEIIVRIDKELKPKEESKEQLITE
jgi:hypothetical protein